MFLGGGATGEVESARSKDAPRDGPRDGSRRGVILLRGAGTRFSSGGAPVGLIGSIGGRFLSGGFPVAGLGIGAKAGAKPDGGGSGALATPGLMPFGLPLDRGRKLSLSLL